jgi:hypothetical protein
MRPGVVPRSAATSSTRRRSGTLETQTDSVVTDLAAHARPRGRSAPLRGRPRRQPWRDQQPVHRGRRKLDTIAAS